MTEVVEIPDPGLGNTSYLVDLGDRSALVVDPERDPRPYIEAAGRRKLRITHVAETHLHADFVSGARELVALGAELIAPRSGLLAHPHRAVGEGDEVVLGGLSLHVIATPGHTPEHVAYVLYDGAAALALFSGGTLMAGGVARPDLISSDLTVPLAYMAYDSVLRLLATLPDGLMVRPTHGGGSLCSSAGATSSEWSTVGWERRNHPAVTAIGPDQFVTGLLAGLGSYPPYFHRLREVNRRGPQTFGVDLPPLVPLAVDDLEGKTVVDARAINGFAGGHIPRSISIELRDQFGTWLGWLFEPDTPLVFVLDPDQDERELVRQSLNIGHEQLAGRIGLKDWIEAGNQLATIDLIPVDLLRLDTPTLDVRQKSEWDVAHLPGATHIELGDLHSHSGTIDPGVVVHCGHGQRAMTAASILARTGTPPAGVTTADIHEIALALRAE